MPQSPDSPGSRTGRCIRLTGPWVAFAVLAAASAPAEPVRGRISFLGQCPGDTVSTAKPTALPALLAPLLTPLLTGVVSQGVKAVGQKLTEEAQEASVDVVHQGDHFYRFHLAQGDFGLAFRCFVVASRGTRSSTGSLAALAEGYRSASFDPGTGQTTWVENARTLEGHLAGAGYSDARLPGIVGVFDLRPSAQGTAARLVPRFVAMDHSVREGRVDGKARTVTFEFLLESPTSQRPFASVLVKLDGLVIGTPFVAATDQAQPAVSSEWFALPPIATATAQRRTSDVETRREQATELEAGRLALTAAAHLGDEDVKPYVDASLPCPPEKTALDLWMRKHAELADETTKPKGQQDARKVAALTTAEVFFESCAQYRRLEARLDAEGLKDQEAAGPFDLTVTLKEFRKRPFAQFFGAVLSESATQRGLTTAIVSDIDPATRAKAEEEREAASLAQREALESAIVAAEKARVVYESADEEDKALRYIDMESKRRAANRRAQALGVTPPYPDSGYWY